MEIKSVALIHKRLQMAHTLEEILCLATLIAKQKLPYNADLSDSENYFKSINEDCFECPFNNDCLGSILNG